MRLLFVCLLHIVWLTSSKHVKKKHYFYIYDTGLWPNISFASLYKRDANERLENMYNHGAGPIINATSGAYHTDQYQLFSMLYYRALKDPRRTLDPSKATSFIIPYDFATDCAFYKNCARTSGVCYDFRKCPLAPKVEELLLESPWMKRNQGRDHLLIIGMNYAMDHYILKPKCKSLIAGICRNCTKFAIDDYSYMYSGDAGILARGDYWHAIPFPGDFHWSTDVIRPFPWENTYRPILASYIGSSQSYYGPAKRLRSSIAHYCSLHINDCAHQAYGLNGTRFSFKVDGHNPLQLSQHSIFCFQPIGDLMTRKGLFDSLFQGCIPVVFDLLTAQVMYTWHWEESFWNEVVVFLPFHGVAHRYFDPIDALRKLYKENNTLIMKKQELIRSKVFELQYGMQGLEELYQFKSSLPYITVTPNITIDPISGNRSNHGEIYTIKQDNGHDTLYIDHRISNNNNSNSKITWPKDSNGHYMRDAYDICIDWILGWHSGEREQIRNATVPECWDGWLDKKANRCQPGKQPS